MTTTACLSACLYGSHLLASLPEVPDKKLMSLVDQQTSEFICMRLAALEAYLHLLMGVDKVCCDVVWCDLISSHIIHCAHFIYLSPSWLCMDNYL
jgi:hypothetical protein